ncbi:MAG: hypothetical protein ACRDX8_10990 [Acidimicrobiales bacterium]
MKASQVITLMLAVLNNLPALESDGEELVGAIKTIFSSSTPPTGAALLAMLAKAQGVDAQVENAGPVLVPRISPQAPALPALTNTRAPEPPPLD